MLRHLERYRSGYNGTVLKTVVRQRTVGSNPTLSAKGSVARQSLIKKNTLRRRNQLEKYSSWWRGAPAKGVGRVTGAGVRVSPSPPGKKTPSGVFFQWCIPFCGMWCAFGRGWNTSHHFCRMAKTSQCVSTTSFARQGIHHFTYNQLCSSPTTLCENLHLM